MPLENDTPSLSDRSENSVSNENNSIANHQTSTHSLQYNRDAPFRSTTGSSSASDNSDEEKPRFVIKKYDAVLLWNYNVKDKHDYMCAICNSCFMDVCLSCASSLVRNKICTVSTGKCKHSFHTHCIDDWRLRNNVCPMDNRNWELERIFAFP